MIDNIENESSTDWLVAQLPDYIKSTFMNFETSIEQEFDRQRKRYKNNNAVLKDIELYRTRKALYDTIIRSSNKMDELKRELAKEKDIAHLAKIMGLIGLIMGMVALTFLFVR